MKRTDSCIEAQDIAGVARLVDPISARMLWYFWENRHARLDELTRLAGESSPMNVLLLIRDVINPAAERVLGRPILIFEKSALDYHSGEHVFHSWWLVSN
ncbi:hypothetical protein ES703_03832 [subsurface metagenome]